MQMALNGRREIGWFQQQSADEVTEVGAKNPSWRN